MHRITAGAAAGGHPVFIGVAVFVAQIMVVRHIKQVAQTQGVVGR